MLLKKSHWLFAAGLAIYLSTSQAQAADDPFPGELFPDDSIKGGSLFPDSSTSTTTTAPKVDPEEIKRQHKEFIDRANESMRSQVQKVASWLQEFSLRNQNRFPGVYGSSNTIERASEVQLTELVGSNPYAGSWGSVSQRELSGLGPGIANFYNSDGTPASGSPISNDEWTSEVTADQAGRINLQMDQSAAPLTLASYRTDPPLNWQGNPGTIIGCGNGQGFIYVYAIGADGKPLKDYSGNVYIVESNTTNTTNDGGQEAGY